VALKESVTFGKFKINYSKNRRNYVTSQFYYTHNTAAITGGSEKPRISYYIKIRLSTLLINKHQPLKKGLTKKKQSNEYP
jgi:hypothetical protein